MSPSVSVTVPLDEYQRDTAGLPFGAAVIVACVAFGAGLVIGMSSSDDGGERPAPRPTPAVQTVVPSQRTAPPIAYRI